MKKISKVLDKIKQIRSLSYDILVRVLNYLFLYIGTTSITTLLIIIILVSIFSPDKISQKEIRFYILIFLGIGIVNCFAYLRLYNAVQGNTKFIIKLNTAIASLGKKINSFILDMGSLEQSMDRLRNTINNWRHDKKS